MWYFKWHRKFDKKLHWQHGGTKKVKAPKLSSQPNCDLFPALLDREELPLIPVQPKLLDHGVEANGDVLAGVGRREGGNERSVHLIIFLCSKDWKFQNQRSFWWATNYLWSRQCLSMKWIVNPMKGSPAADVHISVVKAAHVKSPFTVLMMLRISFLISRVELSYTLPKLSTFTFQFAHWEKIFGGQMIQISGGKSALWWEQKRQMSGGKCDKLGGGKSDKGKWTTAVFWP